MEGVPPACPRWARGAAWDSPVCWHLLQPQRKLQDRCTQVGPSPAPLPPCPAPPPLASPLSCPHPPLPPHTPPHTPCFPNYAKRHFYSPPVRSSDPSPLTPSLPQYLLTLHFGGIYNFKIYPWYNEQACCLHGITSAALQQAIICITVIHLSETTQHTHSLLSQYPRKLYRVQGFGVEPYLCALQASIA